MQRELRSNDKQVYLVGKICHQIAGNKLPSNRQVLAVLFYNIRQVNLTINESANLVARECLLFWEKARLPTKALPHCVKKVVGLHCNWRNLQKNAKKSQAIFKLREEEFKNNLDNLFDVGHANALELIKLEEDKIFLNLQRQPGRKGYLAGIDRKLAEKEERIRQRIAKELEPKTECKATTSVNVYNYLSTDESENETENVEITLHSSDCKMSQERKRGRKSILTSKLAAALDRCQLSVRDSVFVLEAAAEALGHNTDELAINRSTIHRFRENFRKEQAERIKTLYKENIPEFVTVHWDSKLLPALNVRDAKEERLPIVVSNGENEQLIGVPKICNSTGKEQAKAVWNTLKDWGLQNKVQIMCSDTTASNTGRFNGATVFIEQMAGRDILYFPCRHHIYELVLRSVFECKIPQISNSPEIPLFKKLRDEWYRINICDYQCGKYLMKDIFTDFEIDHILEFCRKALEEGNFRSDYYELLELIIMFLGGDLEKRLKIRPPGAMHHARWMAKAIYSLKMCLLRHQISLKQEEIEALNVICIFIVKVYLMPWLNCQSAIRAPHQDLTLLKNLKKFEVIDAAISKQALKKFCQHLWYLNEEISILSIFDDSVDEETKIRMVNNLAKESDLMGNKYTMMSSEINDCFLEKKMDAFITSNSKNLFTRLKINVDFLDVSPQLWMHNTSYMEAKMLLSNIKAVNDVAERAVKIMQDFHGLLTVNEEQREYVLQCVQEHRRVYPNCNKNTLKRKYNN